MKNDEIQILKIIKFTPPIFILIASILLTYFLSMDYKKTLTEEKESIKATYIKEQKTLIKQNVKTAINLINRQYNSTEVKMKYQLEKELKNAKVIIRSIYKNNKDTKTKEEITKLIKDALQEFRFNNGRGYFFINQMNGVSVFHPILPEREGTNIFMQKDTKGISRFQKVKSVIDNNKKGFTSFYFFNPNNKTKQEQKLVYVEYFEPYKWMIGTGEYIKAFQKEIQVNILKHLKDINLGENKYYMALTYDGTFLSHPKKDLEGHNLLLESNLSRMKPFFNKIQNLINSGKGYYEFIQSRKPDTGEPAKKISYMEVFSKWNWIISTGFYEEDIEKLVDTKKEYLNQKYNNYLNTIIFSSFIITLILLFVSIYISKIIEIKFIKYRKKLEKEISDNIKQKNILKKAQEVASIGDWELDINTYKAKWSDQIIKIFGLEKTPDVVGPDFLKTLIHKEDWSCFEESMNKAITEGKEHKCTYRIVRPDGEIRWIECRGVLNPVRKVINGIIQDITDNKKLELEKLHKEELLYQQSKMAAMGEMIGNIAHQWRQPLSTISTAATGCKLQKELGVMKDSEFYYAMDTINDTTQYLSQTINDFRDFYKPNSVHTSFSTKNIIEKSLNLINSQFSSKDIKIIKDIEDITIMSLENELIQVLINILNNARDALIYQQIPNKLIFINIFKNEKDSKKINIEIIDNAKGIPESIINRVFEPYFTTKHKSQGTGIGLYMCEEIIVKHLKGQLLVENITYEYQTNKYTGAKFTIILNKDSY